MSSGTRRPRGRWVGANNWHPQKTLTAPLGSTAPAPGQQIQVDEKLAPLLDAIWQMGLPTTASCQNAPSVNEGETESGEAHINFLNAESAKDFSAIVGSSAMIYSPGGPDGRTSVAFPTHLIPEVLTRVVKE